MNIFIQIIFKFEKEFSNPVPFLNEMFWNMGFVINKEP
jgi:hypothetical protein